jgi:hypothetical protein
LLQKYPKTNELIERFSNQSSPTYSQKNVTQLNFLLNIIKPENYFLAGICKKVFLLTNGHLHSTFQTCSLLVQIWQGKYHFFQATDLANVENAAILACIMKGHFRACCKFCEYLKNFWQVLQVWKINVCQTNTFLNLPNLHLTCQVYICTSFCHTCQT